MRLRWTLRLATAWTLTAAASSLVAAPPAQAAKIFAPEPVGSVEAATDVPSKALIKLADLEPALTKPVNKPYPRSLPAQGEEALAEARAARQKGDITTAVAKLERAAGFDPDNPLVRRLLGLTYVQLPNLGKASDNLKLAAEYVGDDVALQVVLGRLAMLENQTDEAIRRYRLAMLCDNAKPDSPQTAYALMHLGHLLRKQGYWTASLECFNQLDGWLREHGSAYQKEPALARLVVNPEQLMAERGRLELLLGNADEAIKLLGRAYRRDRAQWQTGQLLLGAMVRAKQFEAAEKLLLELAGTQEAGTVIPGLAGDLCKASADADMPQRLWKAYRAANAVSSPLAVALAKAAVDMNRSEEALAILDSLLAETPGDDDAVVLRTEVLLGQNRRAEALDRLATILADRPQDASAVAKSIPAVLQAVGADAEKLTRDYAEQAKSAQGPEAAARLSLAGALAERLGKELLAIDLYERAIDKKPDYRLAYESLLRLYLSRKQAAKARSLFERARQTDPDGDFPLYVLGCSRLAEGDFDEAIDAFEKAQRKDPKNVPTLLRLAEAYRLKAERTQRGSVRTMCLQQSEQALQKVLTLDPSRPETYQALFQQYLLAGQMQRAREMAVQLAKLYPGRPDGLMLLCESHLLANEPGEAAKLVLELDQRFPGRADVALLAIRVDLAAVHGLLPKAAFDRAVERLQDVLRAHPGDPGVLRALAQLLSRPLPKRYADAAVIWGRLYEQSQRNPEAGKVYALALLKADQGQAAVEVFSRLRSENPDDSALRVLYADALTKAGKTDEAIREARQWRKDDPEDPEWVVVLLGLLKKTKQYDEAVSLIDGVTDAELQRRLGPEKLGLLIEAGDYDRAAALAAEGGDDMETVYISRLLNADQGARAVERLRARRAEIEADKKSLPDGWYGQMLYALSKTDKTDEAVELGRAWVEKAPEDLDRRKAVVLMLLSRKTTDAVLGLLDAWQSELDKADPKPDYARKLQSLINEMRAQALVGSWRWDEAEKLLDKVIPNDPNNADLHSLRSTVYGEKGETDKAIASLERALKLRKANADKRDDSFTENNLAYVLADAGRDLDRAESLVKASLGRTLLAGERRHAGVGSLQEGRVAAAAGAAADDDPRERRRRGGRRRTAPRDLGPRWRRVLPSRLDRPGKEVLAACPGRRAEIR